ncbi:hypothetical protein BU17DRAFT_68819 [Hysterangium stoloniferum]|nr:hypothetical protein BU17DRAFT_68819 [Hysterangium stoloniferum]
MQVSTLRSLPKQAPRRAGSSSVLEVAGDNRALDCIDDPCRLLLHLGRPKSRRQRRVKSAACSIQYDVVALHRKMRCTARGHGAERGASLGLVCQPSSTRETNLVVIRSVQVRPTHYVIYWQYFSVCKVPKVGTCTSYNGSYGLKYEGKTEFQKDDMYQDKVQATPGKGQYWFLTTTDHIPKSVFFLTTTLPSTTTNSHNAVITTTIPYNHRHDLEHSRHLVGVCEP